MTEISREVRFFEGEIEGYNRWPLTLEDLKSTCERCGLMFLLEPFPRQGLYLERRGVPVVTVDRRLDPAAQAFVGFWGFFLHHLKPGGVHLFEGQWGYDNESYLRAALLASVALIPAEELLDSLPERYKTSQIQELLSRMVDLRTQFFLHGEMKVLAEQAL